MFRRLGRQFRSMLSRETNLEERINGHRNDRSAPTFEEEELYLQLSPLTASLEEAKSNARGAYYREAGTALLEHFHERLRPRCFTHPAELETLVAALRNHPVECRRYVQESEQILLHRFAVSAGTRQEFGNAIDWFSDFKGHSWMFAHIEHLQEQLQRVDGVDFESPEAMGPIEQTWAFNQLGHFVDLARAYWISGREPFASEFIVQAVDWGERNPVLYGVNWMNPRVVATRSFNWLQSTLLFLNSPQIQGELFARLLRILMVHGATMMNMLERGTTHRLPVAASLFLLCGQVPEFVAAKRWQDRAREELVAGINDEFSPDGLHRSGSFTLHCQATEWLLLCLSQEALNSRAFSAIEQQTELAVEALQNLRTPGGLAVDFGPAVAVGQLGRLVGPSEQAHRILALASMVFEREDFAYLAGEPSAELMWWYGSAALEHFRAIPKTEPRGIRRLYSYAGVAVARDNWSPRANWCMLKGLRSYRAGDEHMKLFPPGPARLPWHDDALSIGLALDGEPVFLEPGCPTAPGQLNELFARLSSHSTVRIGREMEPVCAAPESETIPARTGLEPCRDGFYMHAERPVYLFPDKPFGLKREVLFLPKKQRVVIKDTFDGEGEIHVECNMLLSQHLDILMRGDMGCLLRGKKLQARIIPLFPGRFRYELLKGKSNPFAGFTWSETGRAIPATLLRYFCRLPAPLSTYIWIAWNPEDTLTPRSQDAERLFSSR